MESKTKKSTSIYFQESPYSTPSSQPKLVKSEQILDLLLQSDNAENFSTTLSSIFDDWLSTEMADDTETRAHVSFHIHRLKAFLKDVSAYERAKFINN